LIFASRTIEVQRVEMRFAPANLPTPRFGKKPKALAIEKFGMPAEG
jgi:hypothetical protein